MQVFFEELPASAPLPRHIYAFTLLMRGCYTSFKEISGHIQRLLFFSPMDRSVSDFKDEFHFLTWTLELHCQLFFFSNFPYD